MTDERVSKEHGEMVLTGESRSTGGKANHTRTGQVLDLHVRSQRPAIWMAHVHKEIMENSAQNTALVKCVLLCAAERYAVWTAKHDTASASLNLLRVWSSAVTSDLSHVCAQKHALSAHIKL